MKKGLIITVAGLSTRFNKDTSAAYLKCLFSRGDHRDSLLGKILSFWAEFDKIFIVGGYKFEELTSYIQTYHGEKNIELVFNEHFEDLGSMESLRLGVKAAEKWNIEDLIFAEGDLFFDKESFLEVIKLDENVITVNSEHIKADKAVALYIGENNQVRYMYDSAHKTFFIGEPFKAIYNSAQIWKFVNTEDLYAINNKLTKEECGGTNLILIEKYFCDPNKNVKIIPFIKWFNCNTVADYDLAFNEFRKEK